MRSVRVKCPKCHEVLEIDAESGSVLRHQEEARAKPGGDFLGERLRDLQQEKARREALVAQGREKENTKKSQFDQLFKKVQEEGASGRPAEKPLRDIDID